MAYTKSELLGTLCAVVSLQKKGFTSQFADEKVLEDGRNTGGARLCAPYEAGKYCVVRCEICVVHGAQPAKHGAHDAVRMMRGAWCAGRGPWRLEHGR